MNNNNGYLSIPYSVALTDEHAWQSSGNGTHFFVLRLHFKIKRKPLQATHKVGEVIAVYQHPKGTKHQHLKSVEVEVEEVNIIETIQNHLSEHESFVKLATELGTKGSVSNIFSLSSKLKADVSEKLKNSFSIQQQVSDSFKYRTKTTYQIQNELPSDVSDSLVAVPVYKRCCYEISLAFIDYLWVDYKRSQWALRKKAIKHPVITDFHRHPNIIKFGLSFATVSCWQFLPQSSIIMFERDHEVQVTDPEEITIDPILPLKETVVSFPDVPSLYQIANAAFPKKWVFRKSKEQTWTEEELKNIELEEVHQQRNGWWTVYGPGRFQKSR